MQGWAEKVGDWAPPPRWTAIRIIDAHAAGEPLRVVLSGFEGLRGRSILEVRRDARTRFDGLRRALMWEPRGHADMYGCIVVPPATEDGDFGVLFTHNEGFSTMCGHGIIAVCVVVSELGFLPDAAAERPLRIDTPAGRVEARVHRQPGRPTRVSFVNVASFVVAKERHVEVTDVGRVGYDVAFGGAFYAFVDAAALGLRLVPGELGRIIALGRAIKDAVRSRGEPEHPTEPDLGFLYGTIFVGPPEDPAHHSRNVCVFADGEVDRSPTGTGVSARLALHHARGELGVGESIVIESILGTTFDGRVLGTTAVGPHTAVLPEVSGTAHVVGWGDLLLDPADPLRQGFLLR
jgi:proline racemase